MDEIETLKLTIHGYKRLVASFEKSEKGLEEKLEEVQRRLERYERAYGETLPPEEPETVGNVVYLPRGK